MVTDGSCLCSDEEEVVLVQSSPELVEVPPPPPQRCVKKGRHMIEAKFIMFCLSAFEEKWWGENSKVSIALEIGAL